MSYQTIDLGTVKKTVTADVSLATSIEYRLILSLTEPTPAEGYLIKQVADLGELGKVYIEYKLLVI